MPPTIACRNILPDDGSIYPNSLITQTTPITYGFQFTTFTPYRTLSAVILGREMEATLQASAGS
jgi:hypothetical protein